MKRALIELGGTEVRSDNRHDRRALSKDDCQGVTLDCGKSSVDHKARQRRPRATDQPCRKQVKGASIIGGENHLVDPSDRATGRSVTLHRAQRAAAPPGRSAPDPRPRGPQQMPTWRDRPLPEPTHRPPPGIGTSCRRRGILTDLKNDPSSRISNITKSPCSPGQFGSTACQ